MFNKRQRFSLYFQAMATHVVPGVHEYNPMLMFIFSRSCKICMSAKMIADKKLDSKFIPKMKFSGAVFNHESAKKDVLRNGNCMNLSESVISDDHFFICGFSALLSRELIDESFYIVDVDKTNCLLITPEFFQVKKVFAFISNDLDYYALRHLKNVTFINRRSEINEILSCILVDHSRFNYRVTNKLSVRELQVLSCMQEGLETHEIGTRLAIHTKTFYAHRTRLIKKLQIGNRIWLYKNIARCRAIS